MSGPLRSKQGCWTCRLRRKKCDERRDVCLICESLSITCHGYGAKPDWMDGGERERAVANSIKQIVKHTSRKKGRLGTTLSKFRKSPGNQEKGSGIVLAPKTDNTDTENVTGFNYLEPTGSETSPASFTDAGTKSSSSERNESHSPAASHENSNLPPNEMIMVTRNETVLLMHFLDHVFPLQHPMYKPNVSEGGRSWLLSLLLRTKPLYHASLALSAYHRGSVVLASQKCAAHHSRLEQEKHLAICLEEFQEAIKGVGQMLMPKACPKDLGLMASVVQLIYFELFAGHGNAWQIHLGAATRTFMQGYWYQSAELGILDPVTAETLTPLWEGQPNENVTSFKFLCGIIIWLDILNSITIGKAPCLLTLHSHALGPESHIRLEAIIGSRNWAIVEIGRITALHEHKVQLFETGCLGSSIGRADFDRKVDDIRHELQRGLTEQAFVCLQVHSNPVAPADTSLHSQAIVTRLFALAASIYLYLVVQGSHQETGLVAEEAMTILRFQMPRDMMHVIIFPLYIIGYVAKAEDQAFFRDVFSATPVLEPSLEHRSKILPLLEDAWLVRDDALDGGGWQRSLKRLSEANILLL